MMHLLIFLAMLATYHAFFIPQNSHYQRINFIKTACGVSDGAAAESASAEAETPVVPPNPSLLDIRVGEIVKCWNHPDSEKLLCEEIDCGEESGPRSIASGIRAFYAAEEFVGKKVMVLTNLKDRKLAGFVSQGMVLCASSEDGSEVKILPCEPSSQA